jgi:phosphatidylglycerophosphate synthase
MLDRHAVAFIKPAVVALASRLAGFGLRADQVTVAAFAIGMAAALAIAFQSYLLGLGLILLSRLCDALDGAVARLTAPTDRGGFLDISLDFLYYASIPLAFAISNPAQNALACAVLLAAFLGTGTSFLAYAAIAEKRKLVSAAYPNKAFYFLGGLAEATETLLCFCAMCLWPEHVPVFAYIFAGMCAFTIATRIVWSYENLKD